MSSENAEALFEQYCFFARSPLKTEADIEADFAALIQNPRVQSVGFHEDDVLVVGTDDVSIIYEGFEYVIGQFHIYIVRYQNADGYWECYFRFWNVTNPLVTHQTHNYSLHPHIKVATDDLLPFENGVLCISKGHVPILHLIQKGSIASAVSELIAILEIYPTGRAYAPVERWRHVNQGGTTS